MKEKLWKALEVLFESLFYLVITYTLHSMYTSFKLQWYAIPFMAANIHATYKYYGRIAKITGSKITTMLVLVGCFAVFVYLAYSVGYIHGEFTPFKTLW